MTNSPSTPDSAGAGKTTVASFRRKQLLINPKLQLTMIGFNIALALIMIVIFYIENRYLFAKFTGVDTPEMQVDPIVMELVKTETTRMNLIFAATSVTVIAAMVIGGLILSNRVAGPIYRLMKHIDEILAGKHTNNVKFRDKDFFLDLSHSFNKLMEFFRARLK